MVSFLTAGNKESLKLPGVRKLNPGNLADVSDATEVSNSVGRWQKKRKACRFLSAFTFMPQWFLDYLTLCSLVWNAEMLMDNDRIV